MNVIFPRLPEIKAMTERAYANGDWRLVPIGECNEPLVLVPTEHCYPWYANVMRLTDDTRVFLRHGTYERFYQAAVYLRKYGYALKIYDGWRPLWLQENLYWYYLRLFTASRFKAAACILHSKTIDIIKEQFYALPADLQEEMKEYHKQYVSWPSKEPLKPSPHATGGAVDVWLYDLNKGTPLDLGVPFDCMKPEAGTFYHLQSSRMIFTSSRMIFTSRKNDWEICRRRELLIEGMVTAGFSCLPSEIWHYNDGNQMDALVKEGPARYGYIEPQ